MKITHLGKTYIVTRTVTDAQGRKTVDRDLTDKKVKARALELIKAHVSKLGSKPLPKRSTISGDSLRNRDSSAVIQKLSPPKPQRTLRPAQQQKVHDIVHRRGPPLRDRESISTCRSELPSRSKSSTSIINFYRNRAANSDGTTLHQMQTADFRTIEKTHNRIQWLFPTTKPSGSNSSAPLLKESDIAEFRKDPRLRAELSKSFQTMLKFYGLKMVGTPPQAIVKDTSYPQQKANWVTPGNHNYKRITRMLASMSLLGLDQEARLFLNCLKEIHKEEGAKIGKTSMGYWEGAVKASTRRSHETSAPLVVPKQRTPSMDAVWKETLQVLKAKKYTNNRGKTVTIDTSRSVKSTFAFPEPSKRVVHNTNPRQQLYVVGQDCLQVAEHFVRKGMKVAVLNMANDKTPGGGVRHGARAQEEDLFRRTGLTDALSTSALDGKQPKDFYPISRKAGPGGVLYTSHVPVFRQGAPEGYAPLDTPFEINVLSVAARRNPPLVKGRLQKADEAELDSKIYTMLEAAHKNGDQVVILSALGCGAFNNPPEHVAERFRYIVKNYFPGAFNAVVFAVIDDHNAKGKDGNFLPFAQQFVKDRALIYDGNGQLMQPEELKSSQKRKAPPASSTTTAHTKHVAEIRRLAQTNGFVAFYDKRDPKTEFLGNFQLRDVKVNGHTFRCGEAAFQAGKDPTLAAKFVGKDGDGAFLEGKKVKATSGWINSTQPHLGRNVTHMRLVLREKFKDPQLRELLLATGNAYLLEHCPQGRDAFWADNGDGTGQNALGILLMELRGELGGTGIVKQLPRDAYPKIAKSPLK